MMKRSDPSLPDNQQQHSKTASKHRDQVPASQPGSSLRDQIMVSILTYATEMLTVSKAKAQFSGIARNVVRSKEPVIVRVPPRG